MKIHDDLNIQNYSTKNFSKKKNTLLQSMSIATKDSLKGRIFRRSFTHTRKMENNLRLRKSFGALLTNLLKNLIAPITDF